MRLIDADALIKNIPNTHEDIFENCRNCKLLDKNQIVDIIDEQPTIEKPEEFQWCTDCKEYDQKNHCCHRWSTKIRDTIAEIENSRWIPCSERLPEKGKEVLVCYDLKGHRSVLIGALYGDEKFHGYDDEYLTSEGRKYRKAVAWKPLPEPYKEAEK